MIRHLLTYTGQGMKKQSEKLLQNTGNDVDTLQTISSKMPRTAKNA